MNSYKSSLVLRARLCGGGEKSLVTVAHIPGSFSLPPQSLACKTKSSPCQDETLTYVFRIYPTIFTLVAKVYLTISQTISQFNLIASCKFKGYVSSIQLNYIEVLVESVFV